MTNRRQLKRDSARGVAWNIAQNLLARLLAPVVVAILGRLIDKSAFGVIALALTQTQRGVGVRAQFIKAVAASVYE